MKVEKFKELYYNCKGMTWSGNNDLIVHVDPERIHFEIMERPTTKICKSCGTDFSKHPNSTIVVFKKPQEMLSIFEASLLFNILRNRKLFDYGAYHNCEAGKRFIENIKSIELG